MVEGIISDYLFEAKRAKVSFFFVIGLALSCVALYVAGPESLVLFVLSMGCIGFFLYGPDALMTGAGAIDVGSARTAVLAAGIINGMGSIGSLVQEVIMAKVLADAGTGAAFGILLVCAVGAAGFLSIVLWRNARGLASL